MWCIEALSRLLVSSVHDDQYGDCRASIPVVVTSLVACQLALEQRLRAIPLNIVQGAGGHQQGLPEYEALATVLVTALTLVVRNFHTQLDQFAFPPMYAPRLSRYLRLVQ